MLFLIAVGVFLSMNIAQAQHSCATTPSVQGSKMSDYIHVNTFPHVNNNSYCLTVYVHNVMRGDLTGGVPSSVINTQVSQLNNQFAGTGISFIWDGNVREINDDSVYDWNVIQGGGTCPTVNFGPLNSYAHSDGIDLFFYGRNFGGSAANGIADRAMVAFTLDHASTDVLAHELGHVLGLFHPFHGTIGYGASGANNNNCENGDGFSGHIVECPSGSNKYSSGDYVGDTSAIDTDYTCNTNTCTATAVNDNTTIPFGCVSSEFPDPDITNYMFPNTGSCNPVSCFDGFTPLQVRRMKYFLEDPLNSLPQLEIQTAIRSCFVSGCGSTSCGMVADFNANTNQCVANFNGINNGEHCPNFQYRWYVDNVLVSTLEDFTYDFQNSGTYNVRFEIINPSSPSNCEDSHSENISVFCLGQGGGDPSCPPSSAQMFINEVGNCMDYQANFGGYADIASIDWYYRICGVNGGNEVFLGTTTGNPWNQHTVPIYLPPGNNYDNCILIVNAYPTLTDGSSCTKITGTRTLSCNGNGGGGHKIVLSPNPTKGSFQILNESDSLISEIKVTDMSGTTIKTLNSEFDTEVSIDKQRPGIYFVRLTFDNGTTIIKKLIKE